MTSQQNPAHTEPATSFSELLRQLRERAGLTQEELAHLAHLGVNTIGELERGRHPTCHRQTAQRLADALGLAGQPGRAFIAVARGRPAAAGRTPDEAGPDAPGVPAGPGGGRPVQVPEVRHTLPPDTGAFTGRGKELAQITAMVTGAARNGGVIAIHALSGMPGVGKTALALHVADQLKDRFPERRLFIDLHAHTPGQEPVSAAAALAGLLAATGLDARYLPDSTEARAGLWRDRMAGQRALLVLDNAEGSGQVAPLLPGGQDCLVLITSRRHLGDLPGAVIPVPVEVLPPDEAQQMFLRLAPRASPGPAVAGLVQLAGYLPLAISLLARVHARHPSWTLADLAAETRASLLTLTAEQDCVAAAFELSYRYLPAARQQFLRSLGLHLGTTIDSFAAGALAGCGPAEASGHLDALHREGLLTEVSYRRYGMHDLIRRYATDLAAADPAADRARSTERLLAFYLTTAEAAAARLGRPPHRAPRRAPAASAGLTSAGPELLDGARALAWLRAERANLLGCLDHAASDGRPGQAVALTAALAALLRRDGPWPEAISRHAAAVRAARALGDRDGQAGTLNELGVVRRLSGNYPDAAAALDQALGIYRDLGDRGGEAAVLHDLGALKRMTGNMAGAAAALEEAFGICRDLGDRLGQANALNYLGVVRRIAGNFPDAAGALTDALVIYRDLGDRLGQASVLNDLAEVWRITGRYPDAASALEKALGIYRDLGSRLGQGNVLTSLGVVRRMTGGYPEAAAALEEALDVYRDLGSRLGQANALAYLGVVRRMTGGYPEAAAALEEALGIYRDLGDRGGETEVLNEAGTLYLARGELRLAAQYHQQALDLAAALSYSWDQAHALAGLGRCARAEGRGGDARDLLGRAQEIFRVIGAAETTELAAELAALG